MEESNPHCLRCHGTGSVWLQPWLGDHSEITWCRCGKYQDGIVKPWTMQMEHEK